MWVLPLMRWQQQWDHCWHLNGSLICEKSKAMIAVDCADLCHSTLLNAIQCRHLSSWQRQRLNCPTRVIRNCSANFSLPRLPAGDEENGELYWASATSTAYPQASEPYSGGILWFIKPCASRVCVNWPPWHLLGFSIAAEWVGSRHSGLVSSVAGSNCCSQMRPGWYPGSPHSNARALQINILSGLAPTEGSQGVQHHRHRAMVTAAVASPQTEAAATSQLPLSCGQGCRIETELCVTQPL